jgi:hypothetical protein
MLSNSATLYRAVLRELRQSVGSKLIQGFHFLSRMKIEPPRRVNRTIIAHFRSIAEKVQTKSGDMQAKQDFENAINFLRAQREHKVSNDVINLTIMLMFPSDFWTATTLCST